MNKYAIFHMCGGSYAYAIDKDTISVRLRTAKNDCSQIIVHYQNVYNHTYDRKKSIMKKILTDEYFDMYEAQLVMEEKHFKYFFELKAKEGSIFYTSDGFMSQDVKNENAFFFPVINDDEVYSFPKWAKGALIYQIFIDRFKSSEEKPFVNAKWGSLPNRKDFFGGDFKGIIEKLDYISSLGTDIVYLSPVFSSRTNHKYDIEDYYAIDEMFGGEQDLKQLLEAIHEKGMYIILDCVFNHMSCYNPIFQDVMEKGQDSKYKEWFFIYDYPVNIDKVNYDTFAGCVPSMPKINTSNQEAIDYLVDSTVYWTKKLNIDGWRLDVADEVSTSLWRQFRREILKVNKDALIIGEIWNDATKWMYGDQLHTVTNYKYRKWILDFIQGQIDSLGFWKKIASNNMLYKTESYGYLVNLLGSHDTSRLSNVIGIEKAKLALLATMVYQGMALIYYGDEIGLQGTEDPDNRRTMPWDDVSVSSLESIIELSKLRNIYPALRYGELVPIPSDGRLLAFERKTETQSLEVYLNFGDTEYRIKNRDLIFYYSENKASNTCIGPMSFAICIKN